MNGLFIFTIFSLAINIFKLSAYKPVSAGIVLPCLALLVFVSKNVSAPVPEVWSARGLIIFEKLKRFR